MMRLHMLLLLLLLLLRPATSTYHDIIVAHNISYGPSGCGSCPSCECMDVYSTPFRSSDKAVLFLHGGLWYSGSRSEITEVCTAIASRHGLPCAAADYHYSQDLGGCCTETSHNCTETYDLQAREIVYAVVTAAAKMGVKTSSIYLGGHSAGGHLSALLAFTWQQHAPLGLLPPAGFFGVEGIYNASLWDGYDKSRWASEFACQTRQTFGCSDLSSQSWTAGSPVSLATGGLAAAGPMLLIHSPSDDWVQSEQAKSMFAALPQLATGESPLSNSRLSFFTSPSFSSPAAAFSRSRSAF